MNDQDLNRKPAPDKWSIHDNIAHLALYQLLFVKRIDEIVAGSEPHFGRYIAEEDPGFGNWLGKATGELLPRLEADRKTLAGMILALPSKELAMTGHHPKFGRLTVPEWTEFFLLHEAHHIYTIFQLSHHPE